MITNAKTSKDNNDDDTTVTIKNTRARSSAGAGGGSKSNNSDSSDSSDDDSIKGSGPWEPQQPRNDLDSDNSTNSSKDNDSNDGEGANTDGDGNSRDEILLSLLRSFNQNQRKTLGYQKKRNMKNNFKRTLQLVLSHQWQSYYSSLPFSHITQANSCFRSASRN